MSNEIVVAVVVAILAIYLLRHVITLGVRLIVLAILVFVGYWAWQHRGELIDAAEPYLGDFGDRLREMDLPDLPGRSGDADVPEGTAVPGTGEIMGIVEELVAPEGSSEPDGSEEPDRP